MKVNIISIVILLTIFMVLSIITYITEGAGCKRRAEAQSFNSYYGILEGCMYKIPDGKWVPEKNYRVI